MFSNAITIFTVAGFKIRIDPSWLLIAGLIAWSLAAQYLPYALPEQSRQTYTVMAIAGTIGLFASLILHELAHAVVARSFHVRIKSITLFMFGGLAEMVDEMPSPGVEFWIALAGPVTSITLAAVLWLTTTAFANGPLPLFEVLWYLAMINVMLAVFNLLPAFPMDGGRMLRAWLWKRTNNLLDATRRAARLGSFFGLCLIGLGGFNVIAGQGLGGVFMALIGGFIFVASRSSYQQMLTQIAFKGKTVRSVMTPNPVTIDPSVNLLALVNDVLLPHRISFVPVVENGVLLGHVDTTVLGAIDREHWENTKVGDVFISIDRSPIVSPELAVSKLLGEITRTSRRKFLVSDGQNLLGVATLSDLLNYLTIFQTLIDGQTTYQERA